MKVKSEREWLSHVQLFATPWTAAYRAPPSMGFSRQEYWSGVPSSSPVTGADADLYWIYVPDPPLARLLTWIDTSPTVWTNDSHWFPDPDGVPPNLTLKELYIIILD